MNTLKTTCDKCGQVMLLVYGIRMGNSKENSRIVCPDCRKLWAKVCNKLDKKYGSYDSKWSENWEKEYIKFFETEAQEKVEFT